VHKEATLDVVGIGAERAGGIKRLDLLKQALAEWSARYDYVLFDLPPILLSADAEMLVEALGQVFLVVEAEAETKGEVGRARRLLERIDPEAVGLFVNRVPLLRGNSYMEKLIVETITRENYSRFMSLPRWRLWLEVLRAKWSVSRAGGRG
jgi:Mrp family chromosome partitioning ATPase